MSINPSLYALFNPAQLERFCELFGEDPSSLVASFVGWNKLVVLSPTHVYLIPRDPSKIPQLEKELDLAVSFEEFPEIPLPRLVQRIKDTHLSYYEVGVVERFHGQLFSDILDSLAYPQLQDFMTSLATLIARWHSIPTTQLPSSLSGMHFSTPKLMVDSWTRKMLDPLTVSEAVAFVLGEIKKVSNSAVAEQVRYLTSDPVRKVWTQVLVELALLDPVLVHGDLHEDQLFVEVKPDKTCVIKGVIDWETARLDNPVWDFNFGEWGVPLWEKYVHQFLKLRRDMWENYCRQRRLKMTSLHGLHLYYLLRDFLWLVEDNPTCNMTGLDFEGSVTLFLGWLVEVSVELLG